MIRPISERYNPIGQSKTPLVAQILIPVKDDDAADFNAKDIEEKESAQEVDAIDLKKISVSEAKKSGAAKKVAISPYFDGKKSLTSIKHSIFSSKTSRSPNSSQEEFKMLARKNPPSTNLIPIPCDQKQGDHAKTVVETPLSSSGQQSDYRPLFQTSKPPETKQEEDDAFVTAWNGEDYGEKKEEVKPQVTFGIKETIRPAKSAETQKEVQHIDVTTSSRYLTPSTKYTH